MDREIKDITDAHLAILITELSLIASKDIVIPTSSSVEKRIAYTQFKKIKEAEEKVVSNREALQVLFPNKLVASDFLNKELEVLEDGSIIIRDTLVKEIK